MTALLVSFHRLTKNRMTMPCVLFVVAVLLYAPSLWSGFVSLDDGLLIYKNSAVATFNAASVKYVFTSYDPELYIPLTLLSYQVEHALFGFNPVFFHLTNILLHGGITLLVFALANQLTGGRRWAAFCCALLFAVHPIGVEAVAWAAARKDLLSTLFFFSSLCCYVLHTRRGLRRFWYASLALFLLALFSKVTVATLPLVLLLIDWKEREIGKKRLLSIAPFFVLSGVFLVIAAFGKVQNLSTLSLWHRLLLACKSVTFALTTLVWPANLSVLYQQTTPVTLLSAEFLVPLGVVLLLIACIIFSIRRSRTIAFCLLFFCVTYVPTFATFAKNHWIFYASDRYAYLPSFGIFLLVVAGMDWCTRSAAARRMRWLMALPLPLAMILSGLTLLQQRVWASSETLYAQAIRIAPSSAVAYTNLGAVLIGEKKLPEAETSLRKAVELDPESPVASSKLGELLHEQGRDAEALPFLVAATDASDKRPVLSMEDLAPYYFLGELLGSQGKKDEQIRIFRHAVDRAPNLAEPHTNLGLKYEEHGELDAASLEYAKAIKLHPDDLASLYQLAGILATKGRLQDAAALLERVVYLDPRYKDAAQRLRSIERAP